MINSLQTVLSATSPRQFTSSSAASNVSNSNPNPNPGSSSSSVSNLGSRNQNSDTQNSSSQIGTPEVRNSNHVDGNFDSLYENPPPRHPPSHLGSTGLQSGNSGSQLTNPRSGTRNPESRFRNPRSQFQNPMYDANHFSNPGPSSSSSSSVNQRLWNLAQNSTIPTSDQWQFWKDQLFIRNRYIIWVFVIIIFPFIINENVQIQNSVIYDRFQIDFFSWSHKMLFMKAICCNQPKIINLMTLIQFQSLCSIFALISKVLFVTNMDYFENIYQ